MATTVRARRPPSPPPPTPLPTASKYRNFREVQLDADAKRAAASRGLSRKSVPPGGFDITPAEGKLLFVIVLVALGVRMFRLSWPTSVV